MTETSDADLRHFVRNRLAALRNAAFYLQRRVEPTPVWGDDPRVPQFFALIIHELAEIERAIVSQPAVPEAVSDAVDTTELRVRVLVVDDHDGNRTTMAALLGDDGFRVDEAASFADACACLEAGPPYDVVLLDRVLGDGDGFVLVPLIRAIGPRTRILLVSGGDEDEPIAGIDGVLRKDRGYAMVLARIRELLAAD